MSSHQFIFKKYYFNYITNVLNTNIDKTERIVELSLMNYFLDIYKNEDIIEIGCVSPYYRDTEHKIYDLTDNHHKNIKKNALNLKLNDKYVLSISTIEHFNLNDYNISENNFFDPYEWLLNAITASKKYLITYPLGYNKSLDSKILSSTIEFNYLSRIPNTSRWIEKTKSELTNNDFIYDFSYSTCANCVCIIQNIL